MKDRSQEPTSSALPRTHCSDVRCPERHPMGWRCGLRKNHSGLHSPFIPTGCPWDYSHAEDYDPNTPPTFDEEMHDKGRFRLS